MTLPKAYKFLPGPLFLVQGALFLRSNSRLWRYAAAPLGISFIILSIGYAALYYFLDKLVLSHAPEQWYWEILLYVAMILLAVIFIILFFFLFTRVALAISAPFSELISQKTEEIITDGYVETPFSFLGLIRDSARSIFHSLKILGIYVLLIVSFLLFFLIPGIGAVIFSVLSALLSAFMFSYEFLGYPMDRRRYRWADKKAFLRTHFRSIMGFGLACVGMSAIPVINFLFVPVATVGGTLLFLSMDREA